MASLIIVLAILAIALNTALRSEFRAGIPSPEQAALSFNKSGVAAAILWALSYTTFKKYDIAISILSALNETIAVKTAEFKDLLKKAFGITLGVKSLDEIYKAIEKILVKNATEEAKERAYEGIQETEGLRHNVNYVDKRLSLYLGENVVRPLLSRLLNIIENYEEALTRVVLGHLIRTHFENVTVRPKEALTGSYILVRGYLLDEYGNPVKDGRIIVMLKEHPLGFATTDKNGLFELHVKLPYVYKKSVNLTLIFEPTLNSPYAPCKTTIEVKIVYRETTMKVVYEDDVLWGDELVVYGYVSGPPNRPVVICLNGHCVNVHTGPNGLFEAYLDTGHMKPGMGILAIKAPGFFEYAPASVMDKVFIHGMRPSLAASMPDIAFVPGKITIRGFVSGYVGGGYVVTVEIDGREIVKERANNGSFTLEAPLGIDVWTGIHEVTIRVPPRPPFLEATYTHELLVINVVQMGLGIALCAVAFITLRRFLTRPRAKRASYVEESKVAEVRSIIEGIVASTRGKYPSITDELSAIIDVLARVIYRVQELTGVEFKPYMTLREYLKEISDKLTDEVRNTLTEIIHTAERFLYSPVKPLKEDVERFKRLAGELGVQV